MKNLGPARVGSALEAGELVLAHESQDLEVGWKCND